jgi:hypothetical protein
MRRAITLWLLIRLYHWVTFNDTIDHNGRILANLYHLILQTLGDEPC